MYELGSIFVSHKYRKQESLMYELGSIFVSHKYRKHSSVMVADC